MMRLQVHNRQDRMVNLLASRRAQRQKSRVMDAWKELSAIRKEQTVEAERRFLLSHQAGIRAVLFK